MKRSLSDMADQAHGGSNEKDKDFAQQSFDKFKGMDQQALMAQLLSNIKAQKQEGSFDESMLDNLIQNASGMLQQDQLENMKSLVDQLKKM